MNTERSKRVSGPPAAAIALSAILVATAAGCATRTGIARIIADSRNKSAEEWPGGAAAQGWTNDLSNLGLRDAINIALLHNRSLLAARQEREVARGRLRESYAAATPNITARGGYTRLDDVSRIQMGQMDVALGFEDNYSADITLRQPLFHGAAIPAALKMGEIWSFMAEETVRAAAQAAVFETASAYYDARLAREMINVNEQAAAFAEALLRDTRSRKESGVASDYDVLRAEVEVSNARAELLKSRNAASIALMRLAKSLGMRDTGSLSPADELAFNPQPRPDPEDAVRTALRNRPELRQAEMELKFQAEAFRAAASLWWPQLDAFFTEKWANPDPHASTSDTWGDAWTAGLALSLPLFDPSRDGRIIQEKARLEQAKTRLAEQEEAVALDVRQALAGLQNAEELVESQKLNLQRAEEGVRLALAGFANNTRTSVEVMDAQTALTRTRALYYQALHAHSTAVLNMKRALGILDAEFGAAGREAKDHDAK